MRRFACAFLFLALALPSLASAQVPIKVGSTTTRVSFLLVQSSDGQTGATGLVPTVLVSKAGGAFAAGAGTTSETGYGWYAYTPAASETASTGELLIHASATGTIPADLKALVTGYDPSATDLGLGAAPLPASPLAGTIGSGLSFGDTIVSRRSTVQAATSNTLTLDPAAASTDGLYRDHLVVITSGPGAGQSGTITGYVGATKVATIARPSGLPWTVLPTSASTYAILREPMVELTAGSITAATYGPSFALPDNRLVNLDLPVSSRAAATQIPSGFTSSLFSAPGVFAGTALVSAPTPSFPTDYQQRGYPVTLPTPVPVGYGGSTSTSFVPAGSVQAGSTTTMVVVAGLPQGRQYQGQHLYHQSGESRLIASQSISGGTYTFLLGPEGVIPGAFTSISTGDVVKPTH